MFYFVVVVVVQSLLLKHEILNKLVTFIHYAWLSIRLNETRHKTN